MDSNEDAVTIAPHLHTVIHEDEKMRVLKVVVNPGDKADTHWHPHNMNYILKPGLLRFTKPDGTHVDVELNEGQVTSSGPASHAVENIGNTTVETVQVEIK